MTKKLGTALKSFENEFRPLIEDINAKEVVVRQCADAATMDRIRSMAAHNKYIQGVLNDIKSELKSLDILKGW